MADVFESELLVDLGGASDLFERLIGTVATLDLTAFPAIEADFHRIEKERFDTQGPGWAPLRPATIAIRNRKGIGHSLIMQETGKLMGSLTGAGGSVVRLEPDGLFVGTEVPYAQYHQDGPRQIKVFGRGSATLPRRVLVDITERTATEWAAIVQAALMGGALL